MQSPETVIAHLRHAMLDATQSVLVRAARAQGEIAPESATRWLPYWDALATETYQRLPEDVQRAVVRKLVPGLREVNAEIRRAMGKHVVLWKGTDGALDCVSLEDAKIPVCTNCGAEYPDSEDRCPACGVK